MTKTERIRALIEAFRRIYPDAHCELDHADALQLLVATILSAQCTDKRVNMVTPILFQRCRTARDLALIPSEELEAIIQSTGFFRAKAKSIRACAQALVERHGGEVPRTIPELTALAGVGRKTANVVLGNAFDINEGVVVDTHVGRLSLRLRLTKNVDPIKVEQDLMKLVPRGDWTLFAHWLIFHGRRRCFARKPDCPGCEVQALCPSAFRVPGGCKGAPAPAKKPVPGARKLADNRSRVPASRVLDERPPKTMKRLPRIVLPLLVAAALRADGFAAADPVATRDLPSAQDAATEAQPKLIKITATVDGSGRLVFTREGVHYEHKTWAKPTNVTFGGEPWTNLSATPPAWSEAAARLDLTKAWIVTRKGRDTIALEQTPDGFDLHLCDAPNGSALYEVTLAIPRTPARPKVAAHVPADQEKAAAQQVNQTILEVQRDGSVVWNRRTMKREDLVARLREFSQLSPSYAVIVRSGEGAAFKDIIAVLDMCRDANVWNVSFAAARGE